MLLKIKCPNCGTKLTFDDKQTNMFCTSCGAKLSLKPDRTSYEYLDNRNQLTVVDEKLKKAYELETALNINEAINVYNYVLSISPNNTAALQGLERCKNTITEPNVFINFISLYHNFTLQTSIGNTMITQYKTGDTKAFMLPKGRHIIKFRIGSHRFSRAIMIYDRTTRVNIKYLQDGRNHIEITT